jgi:CHAT domain-containing protein
VVRRILIASILLPCVVLTIRPQAGTDSMEVGRQSAASANENAGSLKERQDAVNKLDEAVIRFLQSGDKIEAARTLNRLGRFQLKLNNPQGALLSHNDALALLKQTPAVEVEVDNLNGLAAVYLVLKEKARLEEILQRSRTLSQQAGYKRGQAEALLTLSDIQNYENHAIALQTALTALELWRSIDDKSGLARTHAHIGRCYMAQNLLAEATQNYEMALQIWRDLKDASEQAEVLIMLGYIEYRKGDWQKVIAFMNLAKDLVDKSAEPKKMGQISAGLAEAFNESGMPEIGLPHYQKALDYYLQTQDPHLVYIGLLGLGVTNYQLAKYAEAKNYFQQVLASAKPASLDAAAAHRHMGRISGSLGDHEDALNHFQKALVIYTANVNPMEAAQVRGLIGQVYEQQARLESAHKYYQEALTTFTTLSDRLNQAAIYFALGKLELKRQNYDAAEKHLLESIKVTEDIRRVSTSHDLTAAFSATVHDRYETYVECLMRKHLADPAQRLDVRAFETSELARGRSLAELLRATQTNLAPGVDPQLAEREKSLRQSLRVKENYKIVILGRQDPQDELKALEAEIARLEAEYNQINNAIASRYPNYREINRPTGWNLKQIQEQVVIDDETLLLEFSLGAEHSHAWAVTRNNITSHELPAEATINKASQDVYELLKSKPTAETEEKLNTAVQRLSSIVLSPVVPVLNKRRIIVVADGALNYIPFGILRKQPDKNEPLIATSELVTAPSASILGQLRQETTRRHTAAKALAAFGDPVFISNFAQHQDVGSSPNPALQVSETDPARHALRESEPDEDAFDPSALQPLLFTRIELANLREVAGPDSFVATGFDATREKLAEVDLAQYAILHIATHGVLDSKHPEKSGLILTMVNRDGQAENGFLGLQDVYNLRAPVNLVVLSACRTGLGRDVEGEGLIGLTRGFMYAGASSVVASLWKVDDEATAELMKRFYANMLQQGMTPAAALRAAQNSIRQEPQWSSPYHWAAFTLQGDYRQSIKLSTQRASYTQLLLVGVLGALLAVAVGLYFRRQQGSRTK